jgi:hypothetical protein
MPQSQHEWAKAMVHEAEAIDHGPSAVLFALGCVKGALIAAARDRAARVIRNQMLAPSSRDSGDPHMDMPPALRARDPIVGILCAICAVGLGVLYMVMGGAPHRLIIINLAALLVGLGLCLWLAQSRLSRDGRINTIAPALGAALLATATFGMRADGAARWVDVAGLVVQPGLLFIPVMLVLHARRGDGWTATGLALSIAATASQPDRAMAGVLVGALAVLALKNRERRDVFLALAAAAGFVVTLIRPDQGGVSPFVDQILFTSFGVHPLAGLGLTLGALLLVVPAVMQTTRGRDPSTALVFGAVWSLVLLAALMGNYPTPLVGYGGSAIVGYLLSIAVLGPVTFDAPDRARSAIQPAVENDADNPRIVIAP